MMIALFFTGAYLASGRNSSLSTTCRTGTAAQRSPQKAPTPACRRDPRRDHARVAPPASGYLLHGERARPELASSGPLDLQPRAVDATNAPACVHSARARHDRGRGCVRVRVRLRRLRLHARNGVPLQPTVATSALMASTPRIGCANLVCDRRVIVMSALPPHERLPVVESNSKGGAR